MTRHEQLLQDLTAERFGQVVREHGPVDGPARQMMRAERQAWLDQLAAELVQAVAEGHLRVAS